MMQDLFVELQMNMGNIKHATDLFHEWFRKQTWSSIQSEEELCFIVLDRLIRHKRNLRVFLASRNEYRNV